MAAVVAALCWWWWAAALARSAGAQVPATRITQALTMDTSAWSQSYRDGQAQNFIGQLCPVANVDSARLVGDTIVPLASSSNIIFYILPPSTSTAASSASIIAALQNQFQAGSTFTTQTSLGKYVDTTQPMTQASVTLTSCSNSLYVESQNPCPTSAPTSSPSLLSLFPLWAIVAAGVTILLLTILLGCIVIRTRERLSATQRHKKEMLALQHKAGPPAPYRVSSNPPVVLPQFKMYSSGVAAVSGPIEFEQPPPLSTGMSLPSASPVSFQTTAQIQTHQIKKGVGLKGIRQKKMGVDKNHLAQAADDSMPDTDTEY
ncbi:Uncharacterized protein PBTT_06118 [Plasmodiophora brassicae]